ncbi:metallophosphoesterase [uncultured Jatrophihabitans sp.]|uniref:metallophosphoesterase family protein n=1 Tax=uncultured Jatrophihabitans sp. TaxID=1610747 RepID=UPI0035CA0154
MHRAVRKPRPRPVARTVRSAVETGVGLAAGVGGAQLGLLLAGRTARWLGPVRVVAAADLARHAGTQLDVPPLGAARVRTHRGPLRVRLTATDVDPGRADGLLRMPDSPQDAADLRGQLHALLGDLGAEAALLGRALAIRSAVTALGGAALAGLAVRRPATATAGAAALLGAAAATAAASVDRDAWRDPALTGLLREAPAIVGDLRTAPQRVDTYRDQLADLLRTGTGVYRRIATLPEPPPADAIRLLHVSDIHLSPLAYPLAQALVEQYAVDAVVDTGDLVDWGTALEQGFAAQIGRLGVPYVYVKGNHDSAGIAAAVAAQPNAVVLDVADGPAEVAGLRFAGMADPRFTPDKTTGDDHAAHRVSERAVEFAASLAGQDVDIALAHDPTAGRALEGLVPLVLAGHTHNRAARRHGQTTVLVQGTSGGSGLRGVQHDPPTPVSLSIVYIDRAGKRLWGVDEVTLGGLGSVTLAIVRRPVADLLAPTDPSAAVDPSAGST